jgi:uncharacterized protein YodC (DUF2158 family)
VSLFAICVGKGQRKSGRFTWANFITSPSIAGANPRMTVSTSGSSGMVLLFCCAPFGAVTNLHAALIALRISSIVKTRWSKTQVPHCIQAVPLYNTTY